MGVGDFKMSDLTGGVKTERFDDLEAGFGGRLFPGIGEDENTLRWGFIRKVYGILSVQILLTTIVAGSVVYFDGLKTFFLQTPGLVLFLAFVPLMGKSLYSLNFLSIKKWSQVPCQLSLLGSDVIALQSLMHTLFDAQLLRIL